MTHFQVDQSRNHRLSGAQSLALEECGLHPEIQVLLGCARRAMTPQAVAAVERVLAPTLRWGLLLQEAQRHCVLPLVHQNLRSHFWAQVPSDIQACLNAASLSSQRRNLSLTAELIRILELLKRAGIAAIPFKGAALAVAAYGTTALRSFADLDLLIHESDLSEAQRLLRGDGYLPALTLTSSQERAYRREECALQFRHQGRDAVVELHWRLTERYLAIDLPVSDFWRNSRPLTLAGRQTVAFSPDDLLLYLCIHACKHKWERLEWLSSIEAVIEMNPSIPWPDVAERGRRYGVDRLMKVTLLLVNGLFGTPVPDVYRDAAMDCGARAIADEALATLFSSQESVLRDRGNWYLFLLRVRERWPDKARIMLFSALRVPHPDAGQFALPTQFAFLHYVLRPIRLLFSLAVLTARRSLSRGTGIPAHLARRPAAVRALQKVSEAKVLPS